MKYSIVHKITKVNDFFNKDLYEAQSPNRAQIYPIVFCMHAQMDFDVLYRLWIEDSAGCGGPAC